jgi:prepilin-type N-terminal cleavage/methylation domain-containing protein
MKRCSKGFSLVEILIVIIIIGILSGTLMIAVGNATSKSEATRIVSNLQVLKTAVIMYYADNHEWFSQGKQGWGVISVNEVRDYMDRTIPGIEGFATNINWGNTSDNSYFIYVSGPAAPDEDNTYATSDIHVYVVANVTDTYADYSTRKQLERMSPEYGIYNGGLSEHLDDPSSCIYDADGDTSNVGGDGSVMMRVK